MKHANVFGAVIGAAALMTSVSVANAADGCGAGSHRGYYGACRPNGYAFAPGWVAGGFYPGRGYWYGGRWWRARAWYGGGWRYY